MNNRLLPLSAWFFLGLSLLLLAAFLHPAPAHAAVNIDIPWLDDIVAGLKADLVKVLQDMAKGAGVLLWATLKLCGDVGLLGNQFSILFGDVITEAINAVISGDIRTVIRGSAMISIGLLGLSLLAKPFWPNLNVVDFRRILIWGLVIQAYLLNAPTIYTQLETMRVDLAEQVAQAVASGSVPGCNGDIVHTIFCITGSTEAEITSTDLAALPNTIPPYGGSETIHQLYNHCVYNPPYYYGDADCDPENAEGDPWEVLTYVQEAAVSQVLSLILGSVILAYGVLQLALGLAAGMMFVLFPVAAIFAFYQPLESFPVGVIRNYIGIFLKSIVLLTLAAVIIRLFAAANSNLLSLAAVGIIALLLCAVMAKEALASLLSSVSFVGNSVSGMGATMGLTSSGGGAALSQASAESRQAAAMIGGGGLAQTLMGAPHPYGAAGGGGGMLGAMTGAPGKAAGGAKAAVSTALGATTGGAGFALGALAASKGESAGGLALMGNTISAIGGRKAGRGFLTGAGAVTTAQAVKQMRSGDKPSAGPTQDGSQTSPSPRSLQPLGQQTISPSFRQALDSKNNPATNTPAGITATRALLDKQAANLDHWTPYSAQKIQETAAALDLAPPEVQQHAFDLMQASHEVGQHWEEQGQSPFQTDGNLDPQFRDQVTQTAPAAARNLVIGQAKAGVPSGQQLTLGQAIAVGAARQRTIPGRDINRGFAGAIKTMGKGGDFDTALQSRLGADPQTVLGDRAGQAQAVAEQMQNAGLTNDLGRQMVETIHDDLSRNPKLTTPQFRDRHLGRVRQWDKASGDPEKTDQIVESLIGLGAFSGATAHYIPEPTTPGRPTAPAPKTPAPTTPGGPASPAPKTPAPTTPGGPTTTAPKTPAPTTPNDPALYNSLNDWRREQADDQSRAAFHVFTNATLQNIAAARPQTEEELLAVKGVGPKKLEQYGQDILDITRQPPEEEQA